MAERPAGRAGSQADPGQDGSTVRLGDSAWHGVPVLLRWVIGQCLRQARLGQGKPLREVAEAAGVSVGHLSEVEPGREEPSAEVLAAICRAFGLDPIQLLQAAQWELAKWPLPRLGLSVSDVALAA